MSTPLVSIIIPIYKVEKYITKCLKSVIDQTYPNIEILLINDCSPDHSVEVVEHYLTERSILIPIHIIHHTENKGLSEARNTGLEHAKGDYIYFLDSDDWISQDCISLLTASALLHQSEIAIGDTICFLEEEQIEKKLFPLQYSTECLSGNPEIFHAFSQGFWPVIAPNKLYKKAFLTQYHLKFYPGLLAEDELWSFQWVQFAKKISFVKKDTYYYLLRSHSIISSKTKKNFEDMLFILGEFTKTYLEERDQVKKIGIKKHILKFKEMLLIMQWRSLRGDKAYLKKNYGQLKNFPKLTLTDYFSIDYPVDMKKKSLLLHLPTFIGVPFFIWRYER
ncbi:glycosyltransferase [Elizabethkingia sp. JS20170427COW]|uniref:glycosyltransferase family 2 protein n=1 Tax=Elizabethkingia sp. JS20170427COW TaxID=2583851 RepID=UPI0011101288|nr:glycosyltransferase [Elizabethkingia sp. JS20170427COW]QCX53428.1 glycosyltransferase [Elizabethkingia sp. JS20170427COW]